MRPFDYSSQGWVQLGALTRRVILVRNEYFHTITVKYGHLRVKYGQHAVNSDQDNPSGYSHTVGSLFGRVVGVTYT